MAARQVNAQGSVVILASFFVVTSLLLASTRWPSSAVIVTFCGVRNSSGERARDCGAASGCRSTRRVLPDRTGREGEGETAPDVRTLVRRLIRLDSADRIAGNARRALLELRAGTWRSISRRSMG